MIAIALGPVTLYALLASLLGAVGFSISRPRLEGDRAENRRWSELVADMRSPG